MRKLPVYFLIDVSESMIGEPLNEVEKGLHQIIRELRKNPYALETVYIGVIVFAGKAKTLVSLSELTMFNLPSLAIGSGTDLGAGLKLLMQDIDKEVQKTTMQKKGDWKPIIFLFTDGAPTTNSGKEVQTWVDKYRSHCNLISVIFGEHADVPLLERIGQQVYMLKDLSPASFREFFKWVSASIEVTSAAVADANDDRPRLELHSIDLEKADSSINPDDNYVILTLRCPSNKKIYLAKYEGGKNKGLAYEGAWPVDEEEYKSLSATVENKAVVDVASLDQTPECPYCGQSDSFLQCNACGQLFCATSGDIMICPWCGNSGKVTYKEHFDIARNLG